MGAANSVDGTAPAACWCQSVDFTAALEMPLPEAARGAACICARCAARATAAAVAPQAST